MIMSVDSRIITSAVTKTPRKSYTRVALNAKV
jgi:hypothetical protein